MVQVIRLKDVIESTTMERRMAAAKPPPLQYSYSTALVEPFIRDVRQRQQQEQQQQQQEEEQGINVGMFDDNADSNSSCENMIDCIGINDDDRRRVVHIDSMPPPLKRQKLM